jgi:MFS transporter, AAHS family, 4-hydroxybenzoate transporter
MPTSRVVNVSEFINERPITSFQILVAAICFLIVAIDGFDTAAIGFLAPAIRAEWSLTPAELAPIFGAGLLGLMSGAFLFGPMADRFGRKTILIVCVLFFGLMSLASSMSTSLLMLVALRFLTGLGLGGAMPNSVTLTSEYCPEHHRRLCHVVVPRARSVGTSGIVRPLRQRSATWSSPQREARGAFGLRGDGVGR